MQGCEALLNQKLQLAKDNLLHQLVDAEYTSVPQLVHEAFDGIRLFEGLETVRQQRKYVKDHFHLVV